VKGGINHDQTHRQLLPRAVLRRVLTPTEASQLTEALHERRIGNLFLEKET